MDLFEVTWDEDEIGANMCGSNFSTRESTWGEMGKKCRNIIANETLYQLSYTPLRGVGIMHRRLAGASLVQALV
jgi:hypothetical protein